MKKFLLILVFLPLILQAQSSSIKRIRIDSLQLKQAEIFYANYFYHLFFRSGIYFLKATSNSLDGQ